MLAFSVILVLSGVISDAEAWVGCSSPSVLSIGALFVVARALEETRAVETIMLPLLGRPSGHFSALLRMCPLVMISSAFLNNTPIVAMMIPLCENWAASSDLSIRVMLMPLSFASMLGGMCTLIGTSTNLVLNAQIEADTDAPLSPLGMFSMTAVALPGALTGVLYLAIVMPLLFQERSPPGDSADALHSRASSEPRPPDDDPLSQTPVSAGKSEAGSTAPGGASSRSCRGIPRYSIEALVTDACDTLIGQEPRHLRLVAPSCDVRLLVRLGEALAPTPAALDPDPVVIQAGDRLVIACLAEGVESLLRIGGLVMRPEVQATAHLPGTQLLLLEASVSASSPLINLPLGEALSLEQTASVLSGAEVWAIRQRKTADTFSGSGTPSLFSARASGGSGGGRGRRVGGKETGRERQRQTGQQGKAYELSKRGGGGGEGGREAEERRHGDKNLAAGGDLCIREETRVRSGRPRQLSLVEEGAQPLARDCARLHPTEPTGAFASSLETAISKAQAKVFDDLLHATRCGFHEHVLQVSTGL